MLEMKNDHNYIIEKVKTKLIALRLAQVHGINYIKSFRLIIKRGLLKIILALVAIIDMILRQIGVVKAYFKKAIYQKIS